MASRKDICDIIAYLKLVFSNYNPDVTSPLNAVDVYEDLLGDLDTDTLRAAVKATCKEDRAFAPTPGEIIAAANRLPNKFDPMATLTKYLKDK